MTDGEYADALDAMLSDWSGLPVTLARSRLRYVVVDPSAASFKVELRGRGYRVKNADNEVVEGIRNVSTHLKGNTFKIHESCKEVIREFGSYLWDEKAQEKGEDKPLKRDDHGPDMVRYYLHTLHKIKARTGQVAKPSGF